VPLTAQASFDYSGETELLINSPPEARIDAATSAECDSPAGGEFLLDGSESRDPDSHPGTNDDIVSFEWFRSSGTATDEFLGSGALLQTSLPLGMSTVTLQVVDSARDVDSSQTTVA